MWQEQSLDFARICDVIRWFLMSQVVSECHSSMQLIRQEQLLAPVGFCDVTGILGIHGSMGRR